MWARSQIRVNCLEGRHAHHYTTNVSIKGTTTGTQIQTQDLLFTRHKPQRKIVKRTRKQEKESTQCHTTELRAGWKDWPDLQHIKFMLQTAHDFCPNPANSQVYSKSDSPACISSVPWKTVLPCTSSASLPK